MGFFLSEKRSVPAHDLPEGATNPSRPGVFGEIRRRLTISDKIRSERPQ
jgi:hypothetical protein